MSGQRTRPSGAADHRSAHPNIPGVPWWGAVLIAVVASAIGFAVDASSGNGELTSVFAALFVIGCVAAVLAVRPSGLFTAVIQPPLILFVVVPGAYFLMHSDAIEGLKDILINCGYPLIERFPLMFFTSAAVPLIGLARWYFGAAKRQSTGSSDDASAARATAVKPGRLSALVAALVGSRAVAKFAGAKTADAGADSPPRRREPDRRRAAAKRPAARPARADVSGRRTKQTSRRPRPDETELIDPAATDRPRRRRPRPDDVPPEPRRRTRDAPTREPRRAAPGTDRRVPYDRERAPQPPQRRTRYDGYEGYQTFGGYDRYDDGYQPRREPPRERGNGTHHPVSRVRYRGGEDADDRVEYRSRRQPPRDYRGTDADRWEYDI